MYNFVSNQLTLMSNNFCHTTLPWKQRSTAIGISCFIFILPAFAITTVGPTQTILKILFPSQSAIALASDWWWSGQRHWSHGADKWHACLFLLYVIILTGKKIHIMFPVVSIAPLYSWYLAKDAVKRGSWEDYVFYHSMWHYLGCSLCYMGMYLSYG